MTTADTTLTDDATRLAPDPAGSDGAARPVDGDGRTADGDNQRAANDSSTIEGDGLTGDIAAATDAPDTISPGAITDGSQVIDHDGYDLQVYAQAIDAYGRLGRLVSEVGDRLRTAPALIRDVWLSFYKAAPRLAPPAPLVPAYELNREILAGLVATIEWKSVRAAGTVGDPLTSAMATIGTAERVLEALGEATIHQINELADLDLATRDLLATAELLDDLVVEAGGDRAADLAARASAARQAAAEAAQRVTTIRHQVATEAEARADTVRRAARAGLAAAEAEIDQTQTALKVFGGGYSVGAGPGAGAAATLVVRQKVALAQQIASNPKLQQIAALAGRLTRVALQVQATRVAHPPDEVTAITSGDDLAHILPAELALLGDPDLEDLFFLRLVERRLMVYELAGHEPQGQGPIVVSLDNSGSMAGAKECWAKAVALALVAIAARQRRDIAILHFGGTPQELRLFRFPRGQASPQELLACCTQFYGGGTVFEPWLLAALRLIDESAFARADVICLSDGLVRIDPAVQAEWQRRRQERGMRCFSVLIGTREGAGLLAAISDALLTLDDLADDGQVLPTIFAV
jgi:uncharacterized protein with von Willebrand factor type A (vWA) domain